MQFVTNSVSVGFWIMFSLRKCVESIHRNRLALGLEGASMSTPIGLEVLVEDGHGPGDAVVVGTMLTCFIADFDSSDPILQNRFSDDFFLSLATL
jgi:hypothetical protein